MGIQSVKNGNSSPGVYFSHNDYASLLLRFLIIVIDSTILLAISILIGLVLSSFNREFDAVIAHTMAVMVPISYYYLAIYKRTDRSTVGYRVLGVKIINLEGKRPSIWQMTLRFFMLFFGPLNFFVDILWLTGEENKHFGIKCLEHM